MQRRRKNPSDVEELISGHEKWLRSGFRQGARAKFSRLDLSDGDFTGLNLSGAHFYDALLRRAVLIDTVFHGAKLDGADLTGAIMFDTVFRRVDLRGVSGLETVIHYGPSTVGVDTLLRSKGEIPSSFLEGVGIPPPAIPGLKAWAKDHGRRDNYHSVFISYGGPDERFATRIYKALTARGVRVYLFPYCSKPGDPLHLTMRRAMNEYDRVVLLCSRESLLRPGVSNEIEEALRREARDGGASILIPVALDDYVLGEWVPPKSETALAIRDRVVADFRTVRTNAKKFNAAIGRLLDALRRAPANRPLQRTGCAGR